MMSALRQISKRYAVSFLQSGISGPCVLCCGFSNFAWSMGSGSMKVKGTCYALENGVPRVLAPVAMPFNYQPRRNAGHSKWANIKHVKQANDMARAREMTKFINLMKAAVREHGSPDPKQNSKLAQIIAQVKEAKLPMASIDRALQSWQTKKDSHNCIYPVKGPGNCIMLIDLESTNLAKSKQELNTVIRKGKGIIAEESVLYMFDHKGLLFCSEIDGQAVTEELLDDATAHAIEGGANDVVFHKDHPEFGNVLEFITEPSAFFKVKGALEKLKYTLAHAEVAYVPKIWMDLSDEDVEAANKLYTRLVEHPDVQNIYVNIG